MYDYNFPEQLNQKNKNINLDHAGYQVYKTSTKEKELEIKYDYTDDQELIMANRGREVIGKVSLRINPLWTNI